MKIYEPYGRGFFKNSLSSYILSFLFLIFLVFIHGLAFFCPYGSSSLVVITKTYSRKYDDGFEDTDTDFGNFMPLPSFLSCIFTADAFSL